MRLRPRRADPPHGVHLQTAGRLGALRVRLTVLLLVLNVAGLAGMGAVALAVDANQRQELVSAELRRTASTAVALLTYDSGSLRVDNLFTDPTAQGPTAVYVYEAARTDVDLVFAHPAGLSVIAPDVLHQPARSVWHGGHEYTAAVADGQGHLVRILVVPFVHLVTGSVAGAVVVVADPRPGEQAHRRLALTLVVGGLIFMVLAGAGGHLLARRGTRPAAEALGQQERFVADAAHELRTPLTVIRAVSEAALREPAQQRDALRHVLRSTDRLADSVDALLTRARLVAGLRQLERQPFRLDQLAEEVANETVQAPHTVRMSVAPVVSDGDPALVRIAVRNLVQNAVRHGRGPSGIAAITLVVADGVVIIEDSGPGLPDAADPGASGGAGPDSGAGRPVRSADRFQTSSADGMGLGLAIAQWVAELHGGSLRLRRSATGGTSATLALGP
jgi:two-component system OmpR family sensor kinase